MSLNSLAANRVAVEVGATPGAARQASAASEDTVEASPEDVQNALSALIEYLPAETVSLYLAFIAGMPVLERAFGWVQPQGVYWTFALLTPLIYVLIYAGKRRSAGLSRFPKLREWPWWPLMAATVAFLAWGLTVPDGPYLETDESRALSGLLAIVVSTFLGILGRVFAPRSA